jgi:hypothetical protein
MVIEDEERVAHIIIRTDPSMPSDHAHDDERDDEPRECVYAHHCSGEQEHGEYEESDRSIREDCDTHIAGIPAIDNTTQYPISTCSSYESEYERIDEKREYMKK